MGKFPENTLCSIQYAIENFVDIIEVDILPIEDGTPVLYHDPFITGEVCLFKDKSRVQQPIPITSLSLEELKEFDCGSPLRKGFSAQRKVPGETIPTLLDVFQFLAKSPLPHSKKVLLDLEFKWILEYPESKKRWDNCTDLTIDLITKYKLENRVIIQSFAPNILEKFYKRNKNLTICYGISTPIVEKDLESLSYLNTKYVSIFHEQLDKDLIDDAHRLGLKVIAWTVNSEKDWRHLSSISVDAITTDYPVELMNFLKKTAK